MTDPPAAAIAAAAEFLHDEECCDGEDTRTCGRWQCGSDPANRFHSLHVRHVEFYRDRAAAVLEAAAPHLTAADPITETEGFRAYKAGLAEGRAEGVAAERERHAKAVDLLKEVLHLRMHGERAPGGNETWHDLDVKVETFLRALLEDAP